MKKFISVFRTLQSAVRHVLAAALVIMVVVVFLQTMVRAFPFLPSLTWSEELSRYLFVIIIVLGINIATTDHLFVRIEIIDNYLKGTARYVMDIVRKLIAIFVSIIFVYSSWRLIQIGGYQVSPAMSIPMWALYGIIFVGFVLNVVAVFIDTYEQFTGTPPEKEDVQ